MEKALVYYSSSEEEAEIKESYEAIKETNSSSKRKLPSLPQFIVNLYPEKKKFNKNGPQSHQGRVRTIEHKEGHFATFLFIKVPLQQKYLGWYKKITCIMKVDNQIIHESHPDQEYVTLSLSKTHMLKLQDAVLIKDLLEKELNNIKRLLLYFDKFEILHNETKVREFLCWMTDKESSKDLDFILKLIEPIYQNFKLEPFYKPAKFHTSLLWCLPPDQLDIKKLNQSKSILNDMSDMSFWINELYFKIGERIYTFELK